MLHGIHIVCSKDLRITFMAGRAWGLGIKQLGEPPDPLRCPVMLVPISRAYGRKG